MNSEPGPLAYTNFVRVGVRVPVSSIGKDAQAQFADVGSNIDCGVRTEEDGRFTGRLSFERSSLYFQGRGDEKGTMAAVYSEYTFGGIGFGKGWPEWTSRRLL